MNVFPLIISLAWVVHRIQSSARGQRNSDPQDTSRMTSFHINNMYIWSQCYGDLGCINNTDEWYHRTLRPIKSQPLPRHIIKTTFILFSKGVEDPSHGITPEPLFPMIKQIRATNFDEKKPRTHLLIHDFTSNGLAGWIKHSVKSLLAIDAGNVISVDWTAGAEPPYAIAVQNARIVALEVAKLLKTFLNEFEGISSGKFHLIGLGVGAHIAGYVGQEINGIGRITGLDPVGLYFKDMPPSTRLDPQDAVFVDVINTDIDSSTCYQKCQTFLRNVQTFVTMNPDHGQGSGDPFGHVNFFPNGGLTQTGCNASDLYPQLDEVSREVLKEGETAPGCSHKRAAKYFTASIDELRGKCTMMGYACNDYSAFKRGECFTECRVGDTCSPMGYSADLVAKNYTAVSNTKFFLDTNDCQPYCLFAYKITIALGSGDRSVEPTENTSKLTISGMFCATVFSDSEDIMFRTNLNLGMGKKPLNIIGDNAFLTYQKAPQITKPDKILLRFEAENNETLSVRNVGVTRGDPAVFMAQIAYVRHVEIADLPDFGDPVTRLCGEDQVTPLKSRGTGAFFTTCDKPRNIRNGQDDVAALRQRRNPEHEPPKSLESSDEAEYDESEPPEPAEDDYYENR